MPRVAVVLSFALLASVPVVALPNLGATDRGQVVRNEFMVDVGTATLHVVEKYAPSAQRGPPRALLFITATLVTEEQWDSDVPGEPSFSSLDIAARRGFFAYTATHEGYGRSSHPVNGLTVTAERMLAQYADLVAWIRGRTGAERVDLVGSSIGSSLAFALSGPLVPHPESVGRVVLTSHIYRTPSPALLVLTGPGGCALMENSPNGYMDTLGPEYALVLWNGEPAAQLWAYQTFRGTYAARPTHEGCAFPVFPASAGRAPVLVFLGDRDLVSNPADLDQFCREYAGRCAVRFVPGMGHAPNFEAVRGRFWAEAYAFLG